MREVVAILSICVLVWGVLALWSELLVSVLTKHGNRLLWPATGAAVMGMAALLAWLGVGPSWPASSIAVVSVLEGACMVLSVTTVALATRHRSRASRVISVVLTAMIVLPISVDLGFVVHMAVWKPHM